MLIQHIATGMYGRVLRVECSGQYLVDWGFCRTCVSPDQIKEIG